MFCPCPPSFSKQGVPKKTLFLGLLELTPLWKGQEIKVRVFFEKFRKFSIRQTPTFFNLTYQKLRKLGPKLATLTKNLGKMEDIFLDWTDFFGHTVVFKFVLHIIIVILVLSDCRHKMINVSKQVSIKTKDFPQKFPLFSSKFFRQGCQLRTQFSQLLISPIAKFVCPSDKEFSEF